MGTTDLFIAFDAHISPKKADADAALGRAMLCAAALSNHYYGTSEAHEHITLIGSLVKHTAVAPISDVDFVFHMPAGTYTQYDSYAGSGQSALLQDVRAILQKRYPQTRIKGDGPVVVVDYSSGSAVEIVPGTLHTNADILTVACSVPVTADGGSWESTDYGAYFDAFQRLDKRRNGQLARLMRYIKTWRLAHNAIIKSLILELMAMEFFRTWDAGGAWTTHLWDDWMLRDFLQFMLAHQNDGFLLPGTNKRLEAGYGWRQDASDSLRNARSACVLPDDSVEYVTTWRKVLGHGFAL